MEKFPLINLREKLLNDNYVLIIGLGFDERCLEVLKNFPQEKTKKIVGISNAGWSEFNRQSVDYFNLQQNEKCHALGVNALSVVTVADEIANFLSSIIKDNTSKFIVDISAMSHELLAVLLGIFNSFSSLNKVDLLYLSAAAYSYKETDEDIWLSRGVSSIRSVLGFPGAMLPSRQLHLIVMTGFEVERATEAVVRFEPASLSIGVGRKGHSVSEKHHKNNKVFFERIRSFVHEQEAFGENVYPFEFSCVDPFQTKKDLLAHIDSIPECSAKNIVVCPLNTKLSTVGVVLAALERPEIQICYVAAIEYNTEGYALPGEDVTIVSLRSPE